MKLRPAGSLNRSARPIVAGLAALVLAGSLSGCGMATRQQAATYGDGQVITQSDVTTTVQQLKAVGLDAGAQEVATILTIAPYYLKAGRSLGWKPDNTVGARLLQIPDATPGTVSVIQLVSMAQDSQLFTQAQPLAVKMLAADNVKVNPRWGSLTFSQEALTTGQVAVRPGAAQENWMAPASRPIWVTTGQ